MARGHNEANVKTKLIPRFNEHFHYSLQFPLFNLNSPAALTWIARRRKVQANNLIILNLNLSSKVLSKLTLHWSHWRFTSNAEVASPKKKKITAIKITKLNSGTLV